MSTITERGRSWEQAERKTHRTFGHSPKSLGDLVRTELAGTLKGSSRCESGNLKPSCPSPERFHPQKLLQIELPGRLDAAGWGLEGLVNRDTLREERELNVSGMIDHPRPCLAEAGKREEFRHTLGSCLSAERRRTQVLMTGALAAVDRRSKDTER